MSDRFISQIIDQDAEQLFNCYIPVSLFLTGSLLESKRVKPKNVYLAACHDQDREPCFVAKQKKLKCCFDATQLSQSIGLFGAYRQKPA